VGTVDGEDALKAGDMHCFICGCDSLQQSTPDYLRCTNCGHEVLVSTSEQGFIINDHLSEKETHRVTGLDRFKARTLALFDRTVQKGQLLDIGSASGKFLFHNGPRYSRATGIEITPESLRFSRGILKLRVVANIKEVEGKVDVATAWHSLEHIPEHCLLELLQGLSDRLNAGGRLIVSVPNGASRQYRWFGRSYAYYDVPNHLHQFTPQSLELLMKRFGLKHVAGVQSWSYNTFGYIQGLLNVTTRTHNYLYYRLKRRSRKPSIMLDIVSGLLLTVYVPAGWMLAAVDMMDLKRQGVITACFEKNTC
jgi:SAM-dependent methyltransferase